MTSGAICPSPGSNLRVTSCIVLISFEWGRGDGERSEAACVEADDGSLVEPSAVDFYSRTQPTKRTSGRRVSGSLQTSCSDADPLR